MKEKLINYRLFLFEIIFACLVIICHIDFGCPDMYVDALGRSSVVFFFIVSNFFYAKTLNNTEYRYRDSLKRALRLFIIAIITLAVYYIIFIPINVSKLGTPKMFSEFTFENILDFKNNYIPRTSFIWFIFALAICYLVFPLINKIKWIHTNKYSIIVPLAILVMVYIYRIFASKYDFGYFSKIEVTRNFFFTGLPCFLIGTYIYDHLDSFKKIKPVIFYILLFTLFGTCVVEATIHKCIGTIQNEFYLSSIVLDCMVIIFCLQNPESKTGSSFLNVFGKHCYMFVYLLHVLFKNLLIGPLGFDPTRLLVITISLSICLFIAFIYNLFNKLSKR